ncbi:MAG: rhodanese-like domain-containing protein [Deltaproteobacteria bacterium]|nr:rhodanese-like domain-containing protein [Deltaproteobacteria bacterium]MCW5803003.1 rhodanese-like domain-containing protein [Deltaproteobacteria bacterium]
MNGPVKEPIATRLAKASFKTSTRRDAAGIPRVAPEFVAEQGQLVRILDVRDEVDLCGPLGHIPAVTYIPLDRIGAVPHVLDPETCVVVISARGGRAGVAARMLEELGMQRVAAMEGGMVAWKQLGFTTLRDPASYRRTLVALAPGIGRDGRPLVAIEPGAELTAEQIAAHVGESTSVRWVKLGAFLLHGKRSCVDGRDEAGVIGTPGGDAGELLLALAVVEKLARPLEPDEVHRVLQRHVDTFGRFYMHSDLVAMNRLARDHLRKDERIRPYVRNVDSAEDWRTFHLHPPVEVREALLEHLVDPAVMGCGHLHFAMTLEDYQVRPGLARAFLEAFHRLRWSGVPELEWIVLGGAHTERAVVNVTVEGELHSYTRIPLVSPSVGGVQMFVNHPQVTSYLRRELAAFLCEVALITGRVSLPDPVRLYEEIERLGDAQGTITLGRLAKGLPVFEIRFDLEGRARVEQRGATP